MMLTNPEPYKEWSIMHPKSRRVLKRLKPQNKLGAEKTLDLKRNWVLKSPETSKELGVEKHETLNGNECCKNLNPKRIWVWKDHEP